ncbi:MAG: hypothetical protein ACTHKU_03985, partial [Verrucomicrobiota bacterium]
MKKGNGSKNKDSKDSGLNFEAQLWAAAEQAMPAPHCEAPEYDNARPERLGRVDEYFPGGCASAEGKVGGCNPFRVVEFSERSPRVAHSSQPWAERHSPVG